MWERRTVSIFAAAVMLLGGAITGAAGAAGSNGAPEQAQRGALTDTPPVSAADPADLRGEAVRAGTFAEALPVDMGASGVAEGLRHLATRASLLMIVAHPDDEDGGMLTYEARGQGVRTGMLTLTRGEGGQNVMSGDFNDALGLVRTRELLAADRYLGIEQMFGTEVDFGFSKTKEEAFSQWSHQRVLYDAVRAVRLFHPLVITSVFLGGPTDGHGQHQVSGEMAQEVFKAAGDPRVFPEMGLAPWSPHKVYVRVPFARVSASGMFDYATNRYVPVRFENYVSGQVSTDAPKATVVIPEGDPSALLGMSYVQFARQGLALQKTQIGSGMRVPLAGRVDVGYTRMGSRVRSGDTESTFFDGVDISLVGILEEAPSLAPAAAATLRSELEAVQNVVTRTSQDLDQKRPAMVLPAMREVLRRLDMSITAVEAASLPSGECAALLQELRLKQVQANATLIAALGLHLQAAPAAEISSATPAATPLASLELVRGGAYRVQGRVTAAAGVTLRVVEARLQLPPAQGEVSPRLIPMQQHETVSGGPVDLAADGRLSEQAALSDPPFKRKGLSQPFYDVAEPALRDAPLGLPALTIWVTVEADGVRIRLGQVVGRTLQGAYQPMVVVPPVSVSLRPAVRMVPQPSTRFRLDASAKRVVPSAIDPVANLSLQVPPAWHTEPAELSWPGVQAAVAGQFDVHAPQLPSTPVVVTAAVQESGTSYRQDVQLTGYPGVVRDVFLTPAETQVHSLTIHVPPGLKIAYLPGTGDAVESSFAQIGIAATAVTVSDILQGQLSGFDAVVLGVRAYTAHPEIHGATAALRRYMEAGGVVVAQYNTADFGSADTPYPLSLGPAEKVVEEDAPVRLEHPDEQVLQWPNLITEGDFRGWVEERGHGFAETWGAAFHAPTEVHDAGQDPQRGGLLVARVGKGAYVYCAFALYRQLPEGVPGAYRLLTNMVSLGRRP